MSGLLDALLAAMGQASENAKPGVERLLRESTPPDQLAHVLEVFEDKWGDLSMKGMDVAPSLVRRLGGVKFARLLNGHAGYRLHGAHAVLDGTGGDVERCIELLGSGSGLSTSAVCDLMDLRGVQRRFGDSAWPSKVVRCLDNFDGFHWLFYPFFGIVKAWSPSMRTDANCDRAVFFCKEMGNAGDYEYKINWLDMAFLDSENGRIDPDAIAPAATMLSAATTTEANICKWICDAVFTMRHAFAENELFTPYDFYGTIYTNLNEAACPKRNRILSMLDGDLVYDEFWNCYDNVVSWPSLAVAIWSDWDWPGTEEKLKEFRRKRREAEKYKEEYEAYEECHARLIHQRLVNCAVVAGNASALKVILSATPPPGPAPLSPAVLRETATFAHSHGMRAVVQALHVPYLRFEVLMRGIQNVTDCRLHRIAGISGVQQHLIEFCDFFELEEVCSVQ